VPSSASRDQNLYQAGFDAGWEIDLFGGVRRSVEAAGQSTDIALELYQKGLVDFLNVLQSEQALYQVQDQFVQHRQDLAITLVALFKALPGGWEPDAERLATSPVAAGDSLSDAHLSPSPAHAAARRPLAVE
jgi:outer membrane protein TolC